MPLGDVRFKLVVNVETPEVTASPFAVRIPITPAPSVFVKNLRLLMALLLNSLSVQRMVIQILKAQLILIL